MIYLPETDQAFIIENLPEMKYLDYDWSLNEQKNNNALILFAKAPRAGEVKIRL